MEQWDPIGVSDCPEAVNEYDSYLGQIARRLREGASPEELASYLAVVRQQEMGLGGNDPADLRASTRIAEWYKTSTERYAKPS
jgi:hypothetical protein